MDKVRVCHMADFHLDSKLSGNDEINKEINKKIFLSLVEIFKMLELSKVDLVLIAGDFYESSSTDFGLLSNIKEVFAKFPGQIVISPGNHDYVSIESAYHGQWPSNVHIFLKERIEFVEFPDLNTRVYGFAFNHSHIYERILRDFDSRQVDQNFINLGVFHGQMDQTMNSFHPIFKEDIENSGLDYIALGHIHKRSPIEKLGDTYYSYSGNPVGRSFNEQGKKGIYLGDISKQKNNLHFYSVNNGEFYDFTIDISDIEDNGELAEFIEEKLKEKFSDSYYKNHYRIYLRGSIKSDFHLNLDLVKENLGHINYIEFYDETKIKIDYESLRHEKNLKGIFVNNVLNLDCPQGDKDAILDLGIKTFEDLLWLKNYILKILVSFRILNLT